jgi:HlyD family secretion protein
MNRAIVLCLLLAACSDVETERVKTERVDVVVQASGELESQQSVMIAPPAVARMWQYQIKKMVPENTQVTKGDTLVSFDDKKVSERLVDKQAELDRAIKELANKKIKETAAEQELVLAVAEKQMEFDKAQRKAKIVDNSRSENDRKKAIIDFTIAENDYFLAQEKLRFHIANKAANLKLAQGKVDRLSAETSQFKRDIARLKVKSPIDGMVIYRANWQGEKPSVGESVNFGQPVMEVAVLEKMQLKAQIEEPDSGKISIGQQVKVILDGTQEIVISGTITSLGKVFRNKSSQDKTRIFDAIIALSKTDVSTMRPGMTARVEVIAEVIEAALTIPTSVVKNNNGNYSVDIVSALGTTRTPVEIAHVIGNKVVIKNGLTLGDEVAL